MSNTFGPCFFWSYFVLTACAAQDLSVPELTIDEPGRVPGSMQVATAPCTSPYRTHPIRQIF
jgi:hypothetical protein